MNINASGPHRGATLVTAGASLDRARAALVLLHGRGATAESILSIAGAIGVDHVAYLAPQAPARTWYPHRFLVPIEQNEPWLSSALAVVDNVLAIASAAGLGLDKIGLAGFSQGACLALEHAVRRPRLYGGIIGLSGGLIGPPGTIWPAPNELAGTPVFLGCGDNDPHIPVERVQESAEVFERAGAKVTAIIYPGMPHTVSDDEIAHVRGMLTHLTEAGTREPENP